MWQILRESAEVALLVGRAHQLVASVSASSSCHAIGDSEASDRLFCYLLLYAVCCLCICLSGLQLDRCLLPRWRSLAASRWLSTVGSKRVISDLHSQMFFQNERDLLSSANIIIRSLCINFYNTAAIFYRINYIWLICATSWRDRPSFVGEKQFTCLLRFSAVCLIKATNTQSLQFNLRSAFTICNAEKS